jgi:hypothetical protein
LDFDSAMKKIRNVYEIFSGYVHAQYPHIMEIYGGPIGARKFNTGGVISKQKMEIYTRLTEETIKSTELTLAFIAFKLDKPKLFLEILDATRDDN